MLYKRHLARPLSLVMAILMLLGCLTACGEGDAVQDDTTASEVTEALTEAETVDEVAAAYDALGEIDWGGDDFVILYFEENEYSEQEIWIDRESGDGDSGDILPDAVYERNTLFEDKCNLKLSAVGVTKDEALMKMTNEVQAKAGDFQLCSVCADHTASMGTANLLYNYLDLDIDLDKPWWDKGTASFNLRDHIFFMDGSYNYSDDNQTWVMLFNKDSFAEIGREEPYDMVTSGKWTLSYFEELIQNFSTDNGDGIWDENDTYGFVSTPWYSTAFFYGSNLRYIELDGEGEPKLCLDGGQLDKAVDLLSQVQRIYHTNNTTFRAKEYTIAIDVFVEERGLFYGEVAAYVIKMNKQLDGAFGVLPVPKYDENQKEYITWVNAWASTLSIPKTVAKTEILGDVLTAYAILSHQYVHPKYYDVVLTAKSAKDPQSIEMLDIVFANKVYDMAMYFTQFEMKKLFENAAEFDQDDYTSKFKSARNQFHRKKTEIFKKID